MGFYSMTRLKDLRVKRFLCLAGLWVLGAYSAQASVLRFPGIWCQGGELTVMTGVAYSAHCSGNLQIDASAVINAEESIRLSALGNATVWGRLTAPEIAVIAGTTVNLAEGSVLLANSNSIVEAGLIRAGGSLVLSIRDGVNLDPEIVARSIGLPPNSPSVIIPRATLVSVPEPATLLLMGAGVLATLGLRRRRRMSPLTQAA